MACVHNEEPGGLRPGTGYGVTVHSGNEDEPSVISLTSRANGVKKESVLNRRGSQKASGECHVRPSRTSTHGSELFPQAGSQAGSEAMPIPAFMHRGLPPS